MYWFVSGYTSKVAGTEQVREDLTFAGGRFLPFDPQQIHFVQLSINDQSASVIIAHWYLSTLNTTCTYLGRDRA